MKNLLKKWLFKEELELLENRKTRIKFLEEKLLDLKMQEESIEEITSEVSVHKNDLKEFGIEEIKKQCTEEAIETVFNNIKEYIVITEETSFNITRIKASIKVIL
jgi:hypothetical protein